AHDRCADAGSGEARARHPRDRERRHARGPGAESGGSMAGDRAARGRIRVDLHIHPDASFACLTDPVRLVEHALSIGLGRIGVTDHNELYNALMLKERYPDRIVAGEEVKPAEGVDVIGFFIEEQIPRGTPARET